MWAVSIIMCTTREEIREPQCLSGVSAGPLNILPGTAYIILMGTTYRLHRQQFWLTIWYNFRQRVCLIGADFIFARLDRLRICVRFCWNFQKGTSGTFARPSRPSTPRDEGFGRLQVPSEQLKFVFEGVSWYRHRSCGEEQFNQTLSGHHLYENRSDLF